MSLITEVDILDEAKECFLTYAEEVLTDRAIPSIEDGLLSSQRKILWTMEEYLNMNSKSKTKKCNAIVGSTLATSYYHGDQACYGVLCKMSQDYLMRYPMIIGQGSLGTQENNDMVASSRYTEAKPSKYADLMFNDFSKNVVPLKETYNGEFYEPVILPGGFPNAICNGRQAIGISMSHNSAPHNLSEVCDALIAVLYNKNLTVDELLTYLPGPDFPLGGTVLNKDDIRTAFATGHSDTSLRIQGDYIIEGQKIIFTSIPYRTYRNKIKEQIENNIEVFDKLLDDFDDASAVGQNKLIFTVKKDMPVAAALNKLFELTDLQTTLSYNMNYIVNGTPKMCSMLDLLNNYNKHQESVLIKATEYDKAKAEERAHILKALIKAVDKIDEVIELIKKSNDKTEAENKLIAFLDIDKTQADAILNMKLGKLTKIDKDELVSELNEKLNFIQKCLNILNNEEVRIKILESNINDLKIKYGDARRTKLLQIAVSKEEKEIETVEPEKCVVIMSESGLIKRVPTANFRTQKRNTKGVKTQDDIANAVIRTNTIDTLMIFSDKNKMYRLLVNDIPVGTNSSQGQSVSTLVKMEYDEHPVAIYSIYRDTDAKYVLFITKQGILKKTPLEEYLKTKKKSGVLALSLHEGDELAAISLLKEEELVLITSKGMAIRINSRELPASSRVAMGVKGITLKEDDFIVAALPVRNQTDELAIFTKNGLGKKIKIDELPVQKRAGKGLMCYKPTKITGDITAATLVEDSDNILIIGEKNSIYISASDVPRLSRSSVGNQIIKNNKIVSVSKA